MKQYSLVGYIKRDDVNYCFLIPIYKWDNKLFFHKLSDNLKKIVDFTPYNKEDYDHEDNFKAITSYNYLGRRGGFRKIRNMKRQVNDSPFFIFKFLKQVSFGTIDDEKFTLFLAKCLIHPEFKNEFLKKEIYKIYQGINTLDYAIINIKTKMIEQESQRAAMSEEDIIAQQKRQIEYNRMIRILAAAGKSGASKGYRAKLATARGRKVGKAMFSGKSPKNVGHGSRGDIANVLKLEKVKK